MILPFSQTAVGANGHRAPQPAVVALKKGTGLIAQKADGRIVRATSVRVGYAQMMPARP